MPRRPTPRLEDDQPIVRPPDSLTVESVVRKPILYTADGVPLVRVIGFVPPKETRRA